MNLGRCLSTKYQYDKSNTEKVEPQTRNHPGHPGALALTIQSIHFEGKTSELKKLSVGLPVEFELKQDISYSVPNYKNKEDDSVETYIECPGSGIISEISGFNPMARDEEYQEVELILTEGGAKEKA